MTLDEFIQRWKSDFPFEYEITENKLIIKVPAVKNACANFLEVPGNAELYQFSDLLNGRICNFVGEFTRCNFGVIGVRSFRAG